MPTAPIYNIDSESELESKSKETQPRSRLETSSEKLLIMMRNAHRNLQNDDVDSFLNIFDGKLKPLIHFNIILLMINTN